MGNLLSILTFFPATAALILAIFLDDSDEDAQINARWFAFVTAMATLLISLWVVFGFEPNTPGFQFEEVHLWSFSITYRSGVDGISAVLISITAFIFPILMCGSWHIHKNLKYHVIACLSLEAMILGALSAADLVQILVFMHLALVPLVYLVGAPGSWNDANSRGAAAIGLWGLVSFALMAAGTTLIVWTTGSSDLSILSSMAVPATGWMTLAFILILAGVMIRVCCWPAHVCCDSIDAGRGAANTMVLLACPMLGVYALVRLVLAIFPQQSLAVGPIMAAVVAVYCVAQASAALNASRMRALLTHLAALQVSMIVLAVFAGVDHALSGAMVMLVSLVVSFCGLYLCVGVLEQRLATGEISSFGGIGLRFPRFGVVFGLFVFGALSAPGTVGFAGVVLATFGVMDSPATGFTAIALPILVFGFGVFAWALLKLYRDVILGDVIRERIKSMEKLSRWSLIITLPLLISLVFFGVRAPILSETLRTAVVTLSARLAQGS